MEGIRTVDAEMGVYLHPSRAADVQQGVHEILNSLLLRFNDEFEGVVLAYLTPRILGKNAKILGALSPYFHVILTARLLLFSPAPGMMIEGKVNKIEKDYIGVVVLGLFNAAIGVVDIRDDLHYENSNGSRTWVSDLDNRHVIGFGSLIRFSVKSLQETEHIIDISGAMLDENTGSVDWIDRPTSSSKKRLKEDKLRSPEDKERKRKKKLKKERQQVDSQELEKHKQKLDKSDSSPKKRKVHGTQGSLVLPTSEIQKELEQGQSIQESNHKFKRKKVKS